ncbi:MAG: hypothetical protein AAF355_11245 [Myxococcota bacterium]
MAPRGRVGYVYITIASNNSSIGHLPPEIWQYHVWPYLDCGSLDTRFASLACSPDGQYLAVGTDVGSIVVWSTRTGKKLFEQTLPPPGAIRAMVWSADCTSIRFVAEGCRRLVSGVLDLETKTINYDSFYQLEGDVASLALSSDGTHVAVGGYCGAYMLLRRARAMHVVYTGALLNNATVKAVSFLPDGLDLIFSTDGGATELRRANSTSAEPICRVPARFGLANFLPNSLAVSPDGTHVAVGGHGGSLILQRARENKVVCSFAVPGNAPESTGCVITSLAFSPNGRHLFCAARQSAPNLPFSTMCMFQVSSGALLYVF